MTQFEKKLERTPYVYNWIRTIGNDVNSTTKNLVRLALSSLTKTYSAATPILIDRVVSSLDRDTAIKAASTTGRINSRQIVREYVEAFLDYDELRQYNGKPTFDQMVEPFRIGKGLIVPVKPLVNIVENGKLVPIFSVGWASFPLTKFQVRLLATVLEDSVFTLSDFKNSPGEFICFPKNGKGINAKRQPLVLKRGDVDLLPPAELRDCLHMYLDALEAAKAILREMPEAEKRPKEEKRPDPRQMQMDLI